MKQAKQALLIVTGCTLWSASQAQQSERTVIASGGEELSNATMQMDITIGEAMITDNSNGIQLSEGFQQAMIQINSTEEQFELETQVFPVPAQDQLNITTNVEQMFSYTIYDSHGRFIQNGTVNGKRTVVNVEPLSVGMYILQITDEETHRIAQLKFIKQ